MAPPATDGRAERWRRRAPGYHRRRMKGIPADDRARLDAAVKSDDGPFTTFLVSPYSRYVARWAAGRGLTPNVVTSASLVLGLAAAAAFATGSRVGLVCGAVLLQVAFTADCVDGQLARYTTNYSVLGAWLDGVFDRVKEYAVFAGLAAGSVRGFGDDVWALAAAALVLQTARHAMDLSWAATLRAAGEARPPPARTPAYWLRRVLPLPIGERFALISMTAAVWTPRVTFVLLLGWGGLAAVYGVAGKARRSVLA